MKRNIFEKIFYINIFQVIHNYVPLAKEESELKAKVQNKTSSEQWLQVNNEKTHFQTVNNTYCLLKINV